MNRFIDAIKNCLENKNWYGALFIALAMPDICGNLIYPTLNPRERYMRWFNTYIAHFYKANVGADLSSFKMPIPDFIPNRISAIFLNSSDCYALRCALLHAGTDDITGQSVSEVLQRFVFTTANAHCNLKNGKILQLNVTMFCEEIIKGVEIWSIDIKNDASIQNKINDLLTIRMDMNM